MLCDLLPGRELVLEVLESFEKLIVCDRDRVTSERGNSGWGDEGICC